MEGLQAPLKEKMPQMHKVEKTDVDYKFNNCARHETAYFVKNQQVMDDKVEPKYRPKFNQLDKNDKVTKWMKAEHE